MRWQNTETPTFAGSAGSAGEPAIVETMQLLDHDGNEVAAFTKAVDGTIASTVDGQPKVYRALLSQTGTDAPVATVLENTLGGAVVWTYSDVGVYIGTLTGAFTANKVAASIPAATTGNDFVTGIAVVRRASDDTVLVKTAGVTDLTAGLDGVLNASPIQILVYP